MTEPRPGRRPGPAPVFWASILLFAALFALLTYRLSAESPSSGAVASRPVQVRKVIKRRVLTTIVPTPGANTISSGPTTSSVSAAPEPVTTSAS
jgi:hypothetical protein